MEKVEKFEEDRLIFLEKATLDHNCEEIDLNHEKSLYDYLMKNVFSGEFDSILPIQSFQNVESDERKRIFSLVRENLSLILFSGDFSCWDYSVEGCSRRSYRDICKKLLDNYDFLLGLVRDGGEDVLKLLSAFQDKSISDNKLVVESLEGIFETKTILQDVLLEMAKTDGMYKGLSDQQKEFLCSYPRNVLYRCEDDHVYLIPVEELIHNIQLSFFGKTVSEYDSFETLVPVLSKDELFENTILDVFLNAEKNEEHFKHSSK